MERLDISPPPADDPTRPKTGRGPGIPTLIVAITVVLAPLARTRAHEYFSFFHQRTTYLENLAAPAAWWANPAVLAGDTNVVFLATNVAPLGDRYLMAEGKAVVPLNSHLAFGIGVLGAGDYQPGSSSTQATEGGVSYESSFAFERPRFQGVVSARHPRIGAVGIIATIGSDGRSVARDSTKSIASGGICVGLLSPPLYFPLYLSVAFSFIHHELHREFLDRIGKLGVLYRDEKGLVEGSLEYTFDMASDEKRGFGVFTPERSVYDILKVLVSVRVYRTVAALGGFSTDLGEKSDTPYFQGSSLHLGAELRRSSRFPFIGGYDLAFHPGRYWRILHRVWFGYRFGVEDF